MRSDAPGIPRTSGDAGSEISSPRAATPFQLAAPLQTNKQGHGPWRPRSRALRAKRRVPSIACQASMLTSIPMLSTYALHPMACSSPHDMHVMCT